MALPLLPIPSRVLPLALLAFTFLTIRAQEAPVSYYGCLQEVYQRAGANLDSLATRFETDLIQAGVLSDRTGTAYREMLQQIASGIRLETRDIPSFTPPASPEKLSSEARTTCTALSPGITDQEQEDLPSRFLDRRDILRAEEIPASLQAASLLELLDADALEDPFYRVETYFLLEAQSRESEAEATRLRQPLPPPAGMQTLGANLLRVFLNKRDQLVVADQLLPWERLKPLVYEHARRFGDDARYIIEPEPDVKFSSYTRLKDQIALAITEARLQYAQRVFGKSLSGLSPEETQWVFRRFPMAISLP
ncbi:hypothetical protein [Robiginitalea sediminis]|uniref:hypothetical protein n=1 Tax=Robiginitalea sediminis TaxID=1982593 RepID=UPI000B4B989E|nr:hypothetical protein [Robiginitalea sediminis]